MKINKHFSVALLLAVALPAAALEITASDDAATLAAAVDADNTAITITDALYIGAAAASGTYTSGPLGIVDGAIFTSGAASIALPPSDSEGEGVSNGLLGDPLCDALIPGYVSYDASVLALEFELEEGFDGISFQFVFGSEEYIEYVGSAYNDVMGVYLNGVQVAFDNDGNPITINGPFFSSGSVVLPAESGLEYDGSTGLLTTRAEALPGTNTLEIVVCDAGDTILDSGLFIASLSGCVGDDCSGTIPCEYVDNDGDGSSSCDDCDDNNADVSPLEEEVCDEIDNDCDGAIDEDDVCCDDTDGDGVCDEDDACPNDFYDDSDGDGLCDSDDDCDGTGGGELIDDAGCSIDDYCPCDHDWTNHGQYVVCVGNAAKDFVNDGLITNKERGAIQSAAARSSCGK